MREYPPSRWTVCRTVTVLASLLFIIVVDLSAKGPTVRIRIEGDSLSKPVEITDREVLRNFGVWDWPTPQRDGFVIQYSPTSLPEPSPSWRKYKVTFFARTPEPRAVYTVVYQFDPNTKQGFVYVPATDQNRTTIVRLGMEDWWFRASDTWERAVRPLIAQAESPRAVK
jgi:hypothetical protein